MQRRIRTSDEYSEDEEIENTPDNSPKHKAKTKSSKTMATPAFEAGEISVEPPPYSPHTPFQRLCTSPLLSSPLPLMSPATTEMCNLIMQEELFQDSDDSLKDPDFELQDKRRNYSTIETSDSDNNDDEIGKRSNLNVGDNISVSLLISPENQNALNDNNLCNRNAPITLQPDDDTISLPSDREDQEDTISLPSDRENQPMREENNTDNASPKKRKRRNPNNWQININKQKRLKGEPYKTKKGKSMPAKPLKPAKCSEQHKCIALVSEEERAKIYKLFRNLPNLHKQRQFVVNHVTKKKKNRDTTQGPSRRNFTQIYTLTVSEEKKIVCRQFFLDTLNITGAFVKGALKKLNELGNLSPDKRGTKIPPNKLSEEAEKYLRDHILSFPAVESHYCRRDSEMQFLDSTLNITRMYEEYKKKCESAQMTPASFEKYRLIFNEYKLSFHKPKKDLCKQCVAFREMTEEEKIANAEAHEKHLLRRDEARNCRNEDKEEGKRDNTILAFNFDLEAVLSTPKGASGPFFYVRKLAVYNLTMYNLGNQDVECFMWDETEGKRGAIEISTCVNRYIMEKPNIKHVRMMSDGCGGQQKNYQFCSMCLITLQQHPTLEIIDHKFFESGHTHMECDSIHSKIEKKSKNIPVYTPDGWVQIVRLARNKPSPFKVNYLLHDEFKDFGSKQQFQANIANNGTKIGLNNAVWVQYRRNAPDTIFVKKSYDKNEAFVPLKVKKKRGKTIKYPISNIYKERINISKQKKQDLVKLCTDLQIPRQYHSFYNELPSSDTARDALPEPDREEDSSSE